MTALSFNYYICPETISLREFVRTVSATQAKAVGLTVRAVTENTLADIKTLLDDHGLAISSLNSAGYFLFDEPAKRAEQDRANKRLVAAAAELKAETLVVITGGLFHGAWQIETARARIADGLAELAECADGHGVHLGLEPIHPIGIGEKGCINTIDQARSLVDGLDHAGLVIDLFHSWWDPSISGVFDTALNKVRLVQICNVSRATIQGEPQRDLLDTGIVDVPLTLQSMRARGYAGYFEFELFPHHLHGRAVDGMVADVARQYARIPGI